MKLNKVIEAALDAAMLSDADDQFEATRAGISYVLEQISGDGDMNLGYRKHPMYKSLKYGNVSNCTAAAIVAATQNFEDLAGDWVLMHCYDALSECEERSEEERKNDAMNAEHYRSRLDRVELSAMQMEIMNFYAKGKYMSLRDYTSMVGANWDEICAAVVMLESARYIYPIKNLETCDVTVTEFGRKQTGLS